MEGKMSPGQTSDLDTLFNDLPDSDLPHDSTEWRPSDLVITEEDEAAIEELVQR